MRTDQVVAVLVALAEVGIRHWVGGGWGVDALVGRQTRDHRDLDLMVDADSCDRMIEDLLDDGFVVDVDWLPVRLEIVHPDRRRIDIHPLALAPDGSGVQQGLDGATFDYPADCFTTGTIAGRPVPCLSADQQVLFHSGYVPRHEDLHDLALLAELRSKLT